jgi:3-dehydroquinate dehydratase-2
MRIDVVQGPNLNLLGRREPAHYGALTLAGLHAALSHRAAALGRPGDPVEVSFFQSNHEGALCDRIQAGIDAVDAFILNAAGYTHTSVALRDALVASGRPAVEVHLSNVHAREPFRHRSLLSDVVRGSVVGLGPRGYLFALEALVAELRGEQIGGPALPQPPRT